MWFFIVFFSFRITKRPVAQVGLGVDRESVTSPEQQVTVPCETALYENGMFSSTQPFCDAADQVALDSESCHVTRAVSSLWVTTTIQTPAASTAGFPTSHTRLPTIFRCSCHARTGPGGSCTISLLLYRSQLAAFPWCARCCASSQYSCDCGS